MSEKNHNETRPEEAGLSRTRRFFLNLVERRDEEDIELENTRNAAHGLAATSHKKGGFWAGVGSPTLGGGTAIALLGAFHGNEWLKKWVWGKNRAQWNAALAGIKGFRNIQVV